MSIKFPRHIWDSAPECPSCLIGLDWEDGDDGDFYQPPYSGQFICPECGETWGEDGPSNAEYNEAERERLEGAA